MRHLAAVALLALSACAPGPAGDALPRLNIVPGSLTVSGVSSGGYMATQYQVAYSQDVAGAGIVAAGPWLCARGIVTRALRDCAEGSAAGPEIDRSVAVLRAAAVARTADDPSWLAPDRVWIFHGRHDRRIGAAVTDSLLRFYRVFVPPERIRYVTEVEAAHGFPTVSEGGPCDVDAAPWILACGYDAAGELLQYLYDGLREPAGEVAGELVEFGQARYVERGELASMAETGLLFVPKDCAAGKPCRLHVAFHGCRQGNGVIGRSFARQSGYNRWADANRVVVLYPQAERSVYWPVNPHGCWDWWGYSGPDYAANNGAQLSAVRGMVAALSGAGSYISYLLARGQ